MAAVDPTCQSAAQVGALAGSTFAPTGLSTREIIGDAGGSGDAFWWRRWVRLRGPPSHPQVYQGKNTLRELIGRAVPRQCILSIYSV